MADTVQVRTRPSGIDEHGMPELSPVCTFCAWKRYSDHHACRAYPSGGPTPLPDEVWNGARSHMAPLGTEARDAHGQPYVFTLRKGTQVSALGVKLRRAYLKREQVSASETVKQNS